VPKPQRRKRGEARCGDGAPDAFVSMVSLAAPPPPQPPKTTCTVVMLATVR
jgi:hypothetical protein